MNVYIPLAFILVLFCLLFHNKQKNADMTFFISMVAICIFSAIRFDFGPDYQSYWNIYDHIKGANLDVYDGPGADCEKGFVYSLQLFPNYTSFIVFNSIVWTFVNYYFISRFADSKNYWFILIFLFFDSTYLLLSLVAMRSTMASYLFIIALFALIKGKRWLFAIIILLATQFHNSSLALMALLILNGKKDNFLLSKWLLFLVALLGFVAKLTGFNPVIAFAITFLAGNVSSFESYGERDDVVLGAVNTSFFSTLFFLMVCAIAVYLLYSAKKEENKNYIYIYKLSLIATFIIMTFGQSMIGDRYLLFLNPAYYVALTRSMNYNNRMVNVVISFFLIIISIYLFASKMAKPYMATFWVYQTVFDNSYIP